MTHPQPSILSDEKAYRCLFDQHPLPMWVCDAQTLAVLTVNQAALREYGYSVEEFLTLTMADLCSQENFSGEQRLEERTADRGSGERGREKLWSGIWQHQHRDGRWIDVEIDSCQVMFGDRWVRLVVVTRVFERSPTDDTQTSTAEEISELVKTQQTLLDRTDQLKAANRELESFAYSVSHDLRAPLRHISGFANALSHRLQACNALEDAQINHYLASIRQSSQRMSLLIDSLLALSQMGRRSLTMNPVTLTPVAEMAIALSQSPTEPAAPTAQISVSPLPTVLGDETLLQQVFINLVENALKFSRNADPVRIEIGSLADGTVFVRDNGVGFSMEQADQLFGAFQRLHSAKDFEGTGIGLAIARRIIHRHGGTIWAKSTPAKGATFFFKIPLAEY